MDLLPNYHITYLPQILWFFYEVVSFSIKQEEND